MMIWSVHLFGGPQRVNHAAVAVNDEIYSFGGYRTGDNYKVMRPMDIHVLNTVNYRWRVLPLPKRDSVDCNCVPYQRYGHTAVVYKGNVYIWGGRNDLTACNVLYCFNIQTRTWSKPAVSGTIPGARDGHSACIIDNCMYIFGGYEQHFLMFSQDVYYLNLDTMQWTYLVTRGSPPSYRDFHTATSVGKYMYIFGGRGSLNSVYNAHSEVYCNQVVVLDTVKKFWFHLKTSGVVPEGRRSHSTVFYNGKLFVFGGFNGIEKKHYNDLHVLDLATCEWKQIEAAGNPPRRRRRHAACLVGDRIFIFGGTSPYWVHELHSYEELDNRLIDQSDLHVLDLAPSLRTLCLCEVVKNLEEFNLLFLPHHIREDIDYLITQNNISHYYSAREKESRKLYGGNYVL